MAARACAGKIQQLALPSQSRRQLPFENQHRDRRDFSRALGNCRCCALGIGATDILGADIQVGSVSHWLHLLSACVYCTLWRNGDIFDLVLQKRCDSRKAEKGRC